MSTATTYDVVILGAGSGGYATALRAAQLGLNVALVEAQKVGGTCLHRGCVPTKAMLHSAEVADLVREAAAVGVQASLTGFDIAKIAAHRDGVVARLHRGLTGLINARGITVVYGVGQLAGSNTVVVGEQRLSGRHVVVATGSRPKTLPDLPIAGHVITSDQALRLEWIPRSAIVLGGGVIGVEFASLWRSFGAQVTIVEALDQLVSNEDAAISQALARSLKRRGITVKTSARLDSVTDSDHGVHAVLADGTALDADLLLMAVGRAPNTEAIGLAEAGAQIDQAGYVVVDEQLRCSGNTLWAVGDITKGLQLAHRGFAQGLAVAERIAGRSVPALVESNIPRVTFGDPEIVSVGLTEAQALASYSPGDVLVETQTAGANARSQTLGATGMVKLVALRDGPIVGVHLIGQRVSELVGEAQLLVNWEAQPSDLAGLIHAHPTQSEMFGEAAQALAGMPLHTHA